MLRQETLIKLIGPHTKKTAIKVGGDLLRKIVSAEKREA